MGSNTEQIQELQALIEQKSTELRETNNKLEQEKQKLSQAKNILLKSIALFIKITYNILYKLEER